MIEDLAMWACVVFVLVLIFFPKTIKKEVQPEVDANNTNYHLNQLFGGKDGK